MAVVDVRYPDRSSPWMGGAQGADPVAITKRRARSSRPRMSTRSGAVNRAWP